MTNINEIRNFLAGCNISYLSLISVKNNTIYIYNEIKQKDVVDAINKSKKFPPCSWNSGTKALIFG